MHKYTTTDRKSIAIIGTSPISMLFSLILSKHHNCIIYQLDEPLGGAWSYSNFNSHATPKHNNIIVPAKVEEEQYLNIIHQIFKRYDCALELHTDALQLLSPYSPNSYLTGSLHPFIENFSRYMGSSIITTNVKKLEVNDNSVNLDGINHDGIVIPSNFYIEDILIGTQNLTPRYETIQSKHIRAILKDSPGLPRYSEDFDTVFDRGGVQQLDANLFVGRVRRQFKALSENEIVAQSSFFNEHSDLVVDWQMNTYDNAYAVRDELTLLKSSLRSYPVYFLETKQFINAFSKIATSLKYYFNIVLNELEGALP